MARQFGVTVQTAQQAAALLSARGLIERVPGRVTFVSGRILSRTIAVVFGANVFGDVRHEFLQQVYGWICKELKRREWNVALYFPMDDTSTDQLRAELGQDAAAERLRGVIALGCGIDLLTWLHDNPELPCVLDLNTAVTQDVRAEAVYHGVAYLLERGYRRLGVVAHTATSQPELIATMESEMARPYLERGLPVEAVFHGGNAVTHADGVTWARTILDGPPPVPEALLVLNDRACMGIIFEVMRRKLDIPADIGIMAQANRGIEIPCPVPLTRIEVDPADCARRIVDGALALIDGREITPRRVSRILVPGTSCREAAHGGTTSKEPMP